MPISTPIARSKTSALARVLDAIPKGYTRTVQGAVKPAKALALIRKFHEQYGIGCTPGQRLVRKAAGKANCLLVIYWPEGAVSVEWLMLATPGTGLEAERLQPVDGTPRAHWLGYELVRRPNDRGAASWTWRRPKAEMAELHALLAELSNKHHQNAVAALLQRIAHQPGFNGVRTQGRELFNEAVRRGYKSEELPMLFWLTKPTHGERYLIPS